MSKYQELCDRLMKTKRVFKKSEEIFEGIFVSKLANYLECDPNMITVVLGDPRILREAPQAWERPLILRIKIEHKQYSQLISIEALCIFKLVRDQEYSFVINYGEKLYRISDQANELFDAMLKDSNSYFIK